VLAERGESTTTPSGLTLRTAIDHRHRRLGELQPRGDYLNSEIHALHCLLTGTKDQASHFLSELTPCVLIGK
jgi:hypothetical protein